MFRALFRSKSHRGAVTHCELHHDGSCAIDKVLLDAVNIVENEKIYIWNIANAVCFITCATHGERGAGMISDICSVAMRIPLGAVLAHREY
jgi:aspartate 1-decarboxylase